MVAIQAPQSRGGLLNTSEIWETGMAADRRSRKRVIVYRAEVPYSPEEWRVEYEAVSDALHFACRDLREGRRRPIEITEDGVCVLDADSIARACEEMDADLELPVNPTAVGEQGGEAGPRE
jgi:hypothetical protein